MVLPSEASPRYRSAAEQCAECLGGEQHFRQFLAELAAAWKHGGKTVVESDSIPGSGQLLKAPLVLNGKRAW